MSNIILFSDYQPTASREFPFLGCQPVQSAETALLNYLLDCYSLASVEQRRAVKVSYCCLLILFDIKVLYLLTLTVEATMQG